MLNNNLTKEDLCKLYNEHKDLLDFPEELKTMLLFFGVPNLTLQHN